MKTFCAKCQSETKHTASEVGRDVVLTCECGHFIKFPASFMKEDMDTFLEKHQVANLRSIHLVNEEVPGRALERLGL